MSGRLSRNSGRRFEQEVVRELKRLLPQYADRIRRASQTHKAHESDVTGVPGLWIECQFAAKPTPKAKLRQAIADAARAGRGDRVVVVFRMKNQSRSLPRFRVALTAPAPEGSLAAKLEPFRERLGPSGWAETPGGLEAFLASSGYVRT